MPSRFQFDPSKVTAQQEIFPKDSYVLQVGKLKAFFKEGEGDKYNEGMRFSVKIMNEGPHKGKVIPTTLYMHNEISQQFSKRILMACTGYELKDEKKFDADFAGKDFLYDVDSGEVGDAWKAMEEKIVSCDFDITQNKQTGDPQQSMKWRPYNPPTAN